MFYIHEVLSCFGGDDSLPNVETPNMVRLLRTYHENGTHGTYVFPGGEEIQCLEPPDKNNEPFVSCIPEGLYSLKKRESPIVKRTTKGKYSWGWEITGVKNREFIMVHVGNYVRDTNGCQLTGSARDFLNGAPVVWSSMDAYDAFVELMEKYQITHISIEEEADIG